MTWINGSKLELIELASSPKVVAIGEIGLDYYRDRAPRKMKQDVLREQLVVAHDFGLPVVLHTRDKPDGRNQVVEDILQILLAWEDELTGVFHSFSFDLETALKVIEIGFFIGITGPITFKKAETLRHLVANVPLDHILVETDAPFLTPHPYRGKRNEPGYVRYVAEEIARVRGMSYEEVSNQTTLNANKLFKWDAR